VTTYFERRGEGSPHMLCLHGFGASTFTWRNYVAPLARHGTVVAYDRPGFGRTPAPTGANAMRAMSFDGQVAHALEFIESATMREPVLIGHSAGGVVAIGIARARPDLVRGLVLLSTPTEGGPPAMARMLARVPGSSRVAGAALERVAPRFAGRAVRRVWGDNGPPTDADVRGYVEPFARPGWGRAWWQMTATARDARVLDGPLPAMPALVITGGRDRIAPPGSSRKLAAALPAGRFVEISDAGHLVHENRPAEVLQHIEAFLESV
jgi:pimeloyl-ACP methyl ester carboxylesterase